MKKILIFLIEFYQKHISCWLEQKNIRCKYYPTCSEYAKQALEKYGVLKGCWLAVKEFLSVIHFQKVVMIL